MVNMDAEKAAAGAGAALSDQPQSPQETQPDARRGRARASTTGAATSAQFSSAHYPSALSPSAQEDTNDAPHDFGPPRRSNTLDLRSPRRRNTVTSPRARRDTSASSIGEIPAFTLRRRNTTLRQSGEQLRPMQTNASRVSRQSHRSVFTSLAGPEDTSALRTAHAPFVHPGYADLNPAYEQPANTKPVWSLAKPLPRVVRPGMVPTMSEVEQIRNQLPGENAANQGLEVDPEDLEKGKIQMSVDPNKLSAQLKDSRAQREHNFLQKITRATRSRGSQMSRLSNTGSRVSSKQSKRAPRRASTWAPDERVERLDEEEEPDDEEDEATAEDGQPMGRSSTTRRSGGLPPHLDPIEEGKNEPEYEPDDQYYMNDSASLTTLGDDEEPDMKLEPIVENIIEEEVHNHHTSWSVVRTQYREFLGELLGVIVQLSIGFSSDIAVTVANKGNPNTTAWAWGFATMVAIYVAGGISGAQFNPVITIVLYIYRGFPKKKMPQYFLAQFLGAFIAAYIAYGLYLASIVEYLKTNDTSGIIDSFVTNQRYTYIDAATAFFNEFYGTLILVVVVLALGDDSNAPPGAGMNAFIVGLTVMLNTIAFSFQTGAALNPSRDFGPRLALLSLGYGKTLFTNPYWFYGPFCGAISGGCVGGALYDIMIFTGGESPINYPWTRTKRAAHKSKRRWLWRLRMEKETADDRDAPIPEGVFQ